MDQDVLPWSAQTKSAILAEIGSECEAKAINCLMDRAFASGLGALWGWIVRVSRSR